MGDVSAPIAALGVEPGGIDWEAIGKAWGEREFSVLTHSVSSLGGDVVNKVDGLLSADELEESDALDVLRAAFAAAANAEHGRLLVTLYVHGQCLKKWETTEDYDRIELVLGALKDVAQDLPVHGVSAGLAAIVVAQAQATTTAMSVEDALSCSCPVALGERADEMVGRLDRVIARERELAPGLDEARKVVRNDAMTQRQYYRTVAKVAEAVCEFVVQSVPARTECFNEALVALSKPFENEDVYESEWRAYRATLERLRDCAAKPRLLVDTAELVYLYPFALEGIEPTSVVARTLDGDLDEAFEKLDLGPVEAHELEVNDLWVSHARPDAFYSGAYIELPELSVKTTGGDELQFAVELRLSRLGNHHLRVESKLEGSGVHELNQALRRASNAMGDEEHASGGQVRPHAKFPEYADSVINAIVDKLADPCKPRDRVKAVTDPGESHVVLTARRMSIQRSDGSSTPATLPELMQVVGATLLFHPVRHLATSLEEWIRYPHPAVANLLPEGYDGDFVVRTDNTTVSLMPASPEWLIDEYEEMIEFVASVPPLLKLWREMVSGRAKDLDRAQLPDAPIDELHDHELVNLNLEQDIRRQLAFLRSPLLCRTRGQRLFLDALWERAGLPVAEEELEQQFMRLAERQDRIAALVRWKEQERTEKRHERNESLSHRIEIVLAVLAFASVAGAFQWFDDAFGFHGRVWAGVEAVFLVVMALVILVAVLGFRAVRAAVIDFRAAVFGRPPQHEFRDLDDAADAGVLRRLYRDVLVEAFSSDELDDVETMEDGLRGEGETNVLASVALRRDGSAIGGIVGDLFAVERVLLVSYLAVRPNLQGRGIGHALVKHALPKWQAKHGVDVVVAEVHDPRRWRSPAENAERRLRFFERVGARVLDVPFVQPALRPSDDRVQGFLLLALDVGSKVDLPSELIAGFVERYYEVAEGAREPDDATLNALLERIRARKTIRLLPISEYEAIPPLADEIVAS
jgi:GNAT superfamily N-acetyltransferase